MLAPDINETLREANPASNYNSNTPEVASVGQCTDVVSVIARNLSTEERLDCAATSGFYRIAVFGTPEERAYKRTKNLLLAVAYGMESKEANEPVKASDAGNLFKSHLYAKDLLEKSPEFLLARGYVTDWAGRNLLGYALMRSGMRTGFSLLGSYSVFSPSI